MIPTNIIKSMIIAYPKHTSETWTPNLQHPPYVGQLCGEE